MRILLSLLAFAVFVGPLVAGSPVNFKVLSMIDSSHEGPDRPRSYITMGARRISFSQPPFCRLSSDPESLSVYLDKQGQQGEFTVINSPFRPEVDFIAKTEDYFKAAEGTLPKEAEATEFKGSNSSLYVVNGWKSIAFDWTYTLFGRPMHRRVAFINIDPEHQIRLTILADEESATAAFATASRFMKSWYWADELNGTYK
jgi:hypothetical protein